MTGGILQLVARGYDDLYIINEPEITYFKIIYRRHTNFAMFPKKLKFNQVLNFGKTGRCRILKIADLVHKLCLVIKLPKIENNNMYKVLDIKNIVRKYPELNEVLNKLDEMFNDNDILNQTHFTITHTLTNNVYQCIKEKLVNILVRDVNYLNSLEKTFFINDSMYFPDKNAILKVNTKLSSTAFVKDYQDLYNKAFGVFAWVKELAHYLVDSVSIEIDGVTIDNHTSELMRSFVLLNNDENKYEKYLEMIGHLEEYYTLDNNPKKEKLLYLPLKFWFNRHSSASLPLCALQYTNIDIKVKMKDFEEVSISNNYNFKKKPKLSAYVLAEYIYIDNDEREKLAKNKLEYLIEKFEIQENDIKDKTDITKILNDYVIEYKLNFKYNVKQLLFFMKPLKIRDIINWSDYNFYDTNSNIINPIKSIKIKFNGRDRETEKDVTYYANYDSYKSYCSSLDDNMFSYTFAIYPQMLQPSGSANFGQLGEASIIFILNPDFVNYLEKGNKIKLSCYAFEYNILRVFSGMGGLAFEG